jgi:hypothetical protein
MSKGRFIFDRDMMGMQILRWVESPDLTCPVTNLPHDPGYYCDACGDIAADESAR